MHKKETSRIQLKTHSTKVSIEKSKQITECFKTGQINR